MIASHETIRIVYLLNTLYQIASSQKLLTLSSEGFGSNATSTDNETINEVYTYSIENFKNKITIKEISGIAHVSPNSFCRYFKSRTKKNYLRFLQELRVGYACKLLIENKLTPAQICYESGFNNVVNFHRYFKLITGKTPNQYKTEYLASYS
jgi:AraC-like DNA-binding protein